MAQEQDAGNRDRQVFLQDCLAGLGTAPPQLQPKYFYDAQGSALFDQICELPEYYLTRTELAIMQAYAPEMGAAVGPGALIIEPGSGSSIKIRLLLDGLPEPAGYVPVDISAGHLEASAAALAADYPDLVIEPVAADFTQPFDLPATLPACQRRLIYFPGSTLGNFEPPLAVRWLRQMRKLAGADGALLLGVDMVKDAAVLEAAYDDAQGVTAAFNRNLLTRMRRELSARLDPDGFAHRALWNATESRIEMHLVAVGPQQIELDGRRFALRDGEHIVTEYSYKYGLRGLHDLAAESGFELAQRWTDADGWFSVSLLQAV